MMITASIISVIHVVLPGAELLEQSVGGDAYLSWLPRHEIYIVQDVQFHNRNGERVANAGVFEY